MNRSMLALYFRRLVLATLPLAPLGASGCIFGSGDCGKITDHVIAATGDGGAADPATFDSSSDAGTSDGGTLPGCVAACEEAFVGQPLLACGPGTADGGAAGYTCRTQLRCIGGRRPAGYVDEEPATGSEAGRWFARAAALEAASIGAFHTLAHELSAHGAPRSLVEAARRAARDEVRHARAMAGLARREGIELGARESARSSERTAPGAIGAAREIRPLAELAVENAVEGCVRECWGALVAAWQAATASDPVVRRAHEAIARDEARHAELGFAVDAWLRTRLSPAERARVEAARRAAIVELSTEVRRPAPRALVEAAGLPHPEAAEHLLDGVTRGLWAA